MSPQHPSEGMALAYSNGENVITQAIFETEDYGVFTRLNRRWEPLSPNDRSLSEMSLMDVSPNDFKVVIEMFDDAQTRGVPLKYEQVSKYEVDYEKMPEEKK